MYGTVYVRYGICIPLTCSTLPPPLWHAHRALAASIHGGRPIRGYCVSWPGSVGPQPRKKSPLSALISAPWGRWKGWKGEGAREVCTGAQHRGIVVMANEVMWPVAVQMTYSSVPPQLSNLPGDLLTEQTLKGLVCFDFNEDVSKDL